MSKYDQPDPLVFPRCLLVIAFLFVLSSWTAMMANNPTAMTEPAANKSSTDLSKNSVVAANHANWIFRAYMVTVIAGAVFSYWVWKSGNDAQAAVQAEATLRISEADAAGKEAQRKAGEANLAAGVANAAAEQAKKEAAFANKSAEEANERAAKLEHDNLLLRSDIAKAQEHAAQLGLDVERLRSTNLLLEKDIVPRSIKNTQETTRALTSFSGVVAVVKCPHDLECRRIAGWLASILSAAAWKCNRPILSTDEVDNIWFLSDGIKVALGADSNKESAVDDRNRSAAKALIAEMEKNNIEATIIQGSNPAQDIPGGQIIIFIGMKSSKVEIREIVRAARRAGGLPED